MLVLAILLIFASTVVRGCVVSDEFVWSGIGRGQTWLPVRDPASYCFLTSARAWHRGSCSVRFDAAVSAWTLEFAANLDEFLCGVRCVSNCSGLETVSPEARLNGIGRHEAGLTRANTSVCAFTYGQVWFQDRERCAIVSRNDYWVLASMSDQASFGCGATCAVFTAVASVTQQVLLTSYGPQTASLLPTEEGFCFLSQGRAFFRGMETCRVRINGPFWELGMNSKQGNFECGARCLRTAANEQALE
jgi:hypothetical protein